MEVDCGRCKGTGKVGISANRMLVLAYFGDGAVYTAKELAKRFGITNSAMCMRLAWLAKHGFLQGRRDGKFVYYELVVEATDV